MSDDFKNNKYILEDMSTQALISMLLTVFALSSCAKYERQDGCHLDKMNVKGNVTRIETIVETTMPLTELFSDGFDTSKSVSMCSGNTEIDFDKHGNVKHSRGYGIDGKQLYDVNIVSLGNDENQIPNVVGAVTNQKIDDVKIVRNDGKVVNAKYLSDGKVIWEQNVSYDKEGNIERIVKEYTSLKIDFDRFTISYKDTTTYSYSDYDSHGNWTKALVQYKGILPKHAHDYTIIRQLTYDGEGKHGRLINRLAEVNTRPQEPPSDFAKIRMGSYGTMSIPQYMALQSKDYMSKVENSAPNAGMLNYLFMSVYDKKDAYATILVSKTYVGEDNGFDELLTEGRRYNKELDDYLCEMNTSQMAQGGVYILKWLPYEFIHISGKDVLKLSYYRYGKGSPIPVYCENYSIPVNDGNTLSVVFSYQSNMAARFHTDFKKAIKSISLN